MAQINEDLLEDEDALGQADSGRLLWDLARAGASVRQAALASAEAGIDRLASDVPPRTVLLASDSANTECPRVLAALMGERAPGLIWERAELPDWAGPSDALLVAARNGMSARLQTLIDDARRRGLALAVVAPEASPIALAAGREPVVPLDPTVNAFAARWQILTPLLLAAAQLGVLAPPALDELADQLEERAFELRPAADSYANPAKALALEFASHAPMVVGSGLLGSVAAETIANVIQHISAIPAVWATLPNGADRISALLAQAASGDAEADFFADRTDPEQLRPCLVTVGGEASLEPAPSQAPAQVAAAVALRRLQSAAEAVNVRTWPVAVPEAQPLTRFAVASALGDFTAVYAALAQGISTVPREGNLL